MEFRGHMTRLSDDFCYSLWWLPLGRPAVSTTYATTSPPWWVSSVSRSKEREQAADTETQDLRSSMEGDGGTLGVD